MGSRNTRVEALSISIISNLSTQEPPNLKTPAYRGIAVHYLPGVIELTSISIIPIVIPFSV